MLKRSVDLRGVEITPGLWGLVEPRLRKLATVHSLLMSNAIVAGEFDLSGLTVEDALAADGVTFEGAVRIRHCRFRNAYFMGSEFQGTTRFGEVRFEGDCSFRESTFVGQLFAGESHNGFTVGPTIDFVGAVFEAAGWFRIGGLCDDADFTGSRWGGTAWFKFLRLRGNLSFVGATFDGDLYLLNSFVKKTLDMAGAQVNGLCVLEDGMVGHLDLTRARFSRAPELGEITVDGWAVLDQAVFEQQVRLRIKAAVLHCHRTIFSSGVSISLSGDLVADGSFFPPPSDISGTYVAAGEPGPRVLSLRRADVAGLTFADVDLGSCLFAGVHHLERSRLGAGLRFGTPPGRFSSPRDVLAEEQWLRAEADRRKGWLGEALLLPAWLIVGVVPEDAPRTLPLDRLEVPDEGSVAETYRALRKAREEGKDSPGAASFYYGEMEMRRRGLRRFSPGEGADRLVLDLYWLLSGYGLRAWRSLVTLMLLMALCSYLLWRSGFRGEEAVSFSHALRVTVASATSFVRPVDDSELNGVGFAVEILLRFAGPALLALSVLSVRARIKR